ncbi:MAG: flagellar hook-length control protein FliK [Deltaproteobacteria bacterium]|nr:flagellar hook-length control protein FliK [Deltaproteobacteria bacterium]
MQSLEPAARRSLADDAPVSDEPPRTGEAAEAADAAEAAEAAEASDEPTRDAAKPEAPERGAGGGAPWDAPHHELIEIMAESTAFGSAWPGAARGAGVPCPEDLAARVEERHLPRGAEARAGLAGLGGQPGGDAGEGVEGEPSPTLDRAEHLAAEHLAAEDLAAERLTTSRRTTVRLDEIVSRAHRLGDVDRPGDEAAGATSQATTGEARPEDDGTAREVRATNEPSAASGSGAAARNASPTGTATPSPAHPPGAEKLPTRAGAAAQAKAERVTRELESMVRARRQEVAASAVNHLTLRHGAEGRLDLEELGTVTVVARAVAGEVDVSIRTSSEDTTAMLQSTSGLLEGELRRDSLEIRHLSVEHERGERRDDGDDGRRREPRRDDAEEPHRPAPNPGEDDFESSVRFVLSGHEAPPAR